MVIHVRNWTDPYAQFKAFTDGTSRTVLALQNLMWLAGWTVDSDNSDAVWASHILNEVSGASGLSVSSSTPLQVYSPTGIFSQANVDDGDTLILKDAINETNCGAWRIQRYIDANNVAIDSAGAPPQGWVTQTQITARVVNIAEGQLGNGAWAIMAAPGGSNLHVRMTHVDRTNAYLYARPKGGLADPTETTVLAISDYYQGNTRYNATLDGKNVLLYHFFEYTNSANAGYGMYMVGELEDVTALDTNPGFVMGDRSAQDEWYYEYPVYMLDHADVPIQAYVVTWKLYDAQDNDSNVLRSNADGFRLINGNPGYVPRWPMYVCLAGAATGIRGKLPFLRQVSSSQPTYAKMDQQGEYYHLYLGLAVPGRGALDQLLVRPA